MSSINDVFFKNINRNLLSQAISATQGCQIEILTKTRRGMKDHKLCGSNIDCKILLKLKNILIYLILYLDIINFKEEFRYLFNSYSLTIFQIILYWKVWGVNRGRKKISPSILHFRRGKKARFVGFSNKKKNMRKNFFSSSASPKTSTYQEEEKRYIAPSQTRNSHRPENRHGHKYNKQSVWDE